MNLGNSLVSLIRGPVRIGLAASEATLDVVGGALSVAKQVLGDPGSDQGLGSVVHLFGIDDTVARANRLARLLDEHAPLGRMLRPGGLIDRLTAPDGVLDRLTAEDGTLERAFAPGGLVDQMWGEDGLVERLLAEDGLAERLLAKGGLVDTLTARNGPLEQLTVAVDTLNRLAPGLEALDPTIEMLREAVSTLIALLNPLTSITGRIPLPGRPPRPPTARPASSRRVVEHDK
jgi:hypothetical protein